MADDAWTFPLFAAFAVSIMAFNFWKRHGRVAAWTAWAQAKGFTAVGGGPFHPPDLSGKRGGVPVAVVVERRRSGKHTRLVPVVRATISAHLPRGLHLRREVMLDGVAKLIGEQDIRIGDPWLDDHVMIQSDAPADAVRGLLTQPSVRPALRRLFESSAGGTFLLGDRAVRVKDGEVVVELPTLDVGPLDTAVRVAAEAARALALAAGAPAESLAGPDELASLDEKRGGRRYAVVSTAADRRKALPPDSPADPKPMAPPDPPPSPFVGGAGRTLAWPAGDGPPPPAAPAPPTAPPPAAPAPPAPPPASAAPAPAPPDDPLWQGIQAFRDRRVPLGEKDAALRALGARPCGGALTVERVDWTSGLRVGPGLDGGRTVIGSLDTLPGTVALRFPAADNPAIDALPRGARLAVVAQIVGWDELFERAVLELDPSTPRPLAAPGR